MRPERENIAAPDLPEGSEWIGEAPRSMPLATAGGPVLVHFFDFAQLNSVRTLPYVSEWARRYRPLGLTTNGGQAPPFLFAATREAVGAGYATVEGTGEIAIELDGSVMSSAAVSGPALYTLAEHPKHEQHTIALRPTPGLRIWSISFSAGVP